MQSSPTPILDTIAVYLEASGQYRVLRHLPDETSDLAAPHPDHSKGLVVDIETTGLNPAADRIIQHALLPFSYLPDSGEITGAGPCVAYYEDPGEPLSESIIRLTGITDDLLAGRTMDDSAIERLLSGCSLVVAHHAAFDRVFLERRIPAFGQVPWGCSVRDVPWAEMGVGSTKLDYVLYRHAGMFHDGHRADTDCRATLQVLATPCASGETPLYHVLQAVRRTTVRLWAVNSPYPLKDMLKDRGYRWSNGAPGKRRGWYCDIGEEQEADETAWLEQHIYGGRGGCWCRETIDALRRYSENY